MGLHIVQTSQYFTTIKKTKLNLRNDDATQFYQPAMSMEGQTPQTVFQQVRRPKDLFCTIVY